MAIVEVAIGVALLFFLLSIVCSTVNEWIAWALSLRAQTLEKGLREQIQDPAKLNALLSHPLIAPLKKKNKLLSASRYRRDRLMPSYLPSRTFALAFIDTLLPATAGGQPATLEAVRGSLAKLPEYLRAPLLAQIDASDNEIGKFREGLETWYDSSMERVSGWYKRRVQLILLVIATAATIGVNVDSYHVARTLWQEPTMRAAIADSTAQAIEACRMTEETQPTTDEAQPIEDCEIYLEVAKQTEALWALPIGWSNVPWPSDAVGWLARVFGWLITIVAVSLGAPFWFDVLGKLSNLRASGAKPPHPTSGRAAALIGP